MNSKIENTDLCADCHHTALDHGSEGRCYHVERTVEPVKRCHCDQFKEAQK